MNILNVTFNSINASRTGVPKGKISIANNVKITSVEDAKLGLDKTKSALKFLFGYDTEYNPDFAKIALTGEVLILMEGDQAKEILEKWSKNKQIDKEIAKVVINNVMNKCSLEAILLSRELGLPSPIPLPSIKEDAEKQEK